MHQKKKNKLKFLSYFENFAQAPVSTQNKIKSKLPTASAEQVVDRFIKELRKNKQPIDLNIDEVMDRIKNEPKPTTKPTTKPDTKPGRTTPIPHRRPSVNPRPKAYYESLETETSVELLNSISSYVEDHGTFNGKTMHISEFVNNMCKFFNCEKEEIMMALTNLPVVDDPNKTGETLYLHEVDNDMYLVLDEANPKKILLQGYRDLSEIDW